MSYDPTQPVSPQGYPPAPQPSLPPQAASPGYPLPEDGSFDPGPRYSALPPDASPGVGFAARPFGQRLGPAGKAALLVGLLTLIVFFLPWRVAPDPNGTATYTGLGSANGRLTFSNTATQSGFGIAIGVEDPQFNKIANANLQGGTITYKTDGSNPPTVTLYLHLWLVPLGALALIAAAWFLSQRRISSRLTTLTLIASSALSLIMETSFLVAVNSTESNDEHIYSGLHVHLASPIIAVSWGFWLAWIISVLGLGAGIYLLRQERKTLNPAAAVAQPYSGHLPGAPPGYPGL